MLEDKFLIMTIDTSCKTTACGLVADLSLIADCSVCDNKTHSVKLMPLIDSALSSVDATIDNVDLIAVTNGPGSYTGLRIGVVTAKTFAYAADIPVIGVNTLDALAYQYLNDKDTITISIIDARNTRVYAACFKGNNIILNHNALTVEELCNFLSGEKSIDPKKNPLLFCGDGVNDTNKSIIDNLLKEYNVIYKDLIYPQSLSIAKIAYQKYCDSSMDRSLYKGQVLGVDYMKKYNSEI